MMPIAAYYLTIGALALTMAWQSGPQRLLDAGSTTAFTVRKEGRIVESWIALQFNADEMEGSKHWPAFARATPCVVVESGEGQWSGARAFCGNPHWLNDNAYTIHDLRSLAPGVPFDFKRDASGFAMPEFRLDKAAVGYFTTQHAMNPFRDYSALEELRRRFDRPVDLAIAS